MVTEDVAGEDAVPEDTAPAEEEACMLRF